MREPLIYRCQALTKAGRRCRLHGPNGYCHLHRLETVDEQMARERAGAERGLDRQARKRES